MTPTPADPISVVSWNVNSLGPLKSQRCFINKLKGMKVNIFILGDTRLGKEKEEVFRQMWGGTAYFNSFCSNKRGLAVLIKNDTPISIVQRENVIPRNFSKLSFKANDQTVLVKCIYAPNHDSNPNDDNNDSTEFFRKVMDDTGDEKYNHRMIAGDYNVALKHDIDTSGYLHVNNPHTREYVTRQANLAILLIPR